MGNPKRLARQNAVPWDVTANALLGFYERSHPAFSYRDEVLELVSDAHKLYVLGFPRPSMIMSGEGLLRAIYDRLVVLVTKRGKEEYRINGRTFELRRRDIGEAPLDWNDRLSFNEAIFVLRKSRVYSRSVTDRMFVVKELRNLATHRHLPLIERYDPDEPRPRQEFVKLLSGDIQIPEGYRFRPFKDRGQWFTFACRDHGTGSLKEFTAGDKFAAIQLVLTVETVAEMLSYP